MGVSKNLKLFFYKFSAKMWLLYLIWDFFARKSVHSRVSLKGWLGLPRNLKWGCEIFIFLIAVSWNHEKFISCFYLQRRLQLIDKAILLIIQRFQESLIENHLKYQLIYNGTTFSRTKWTSNCSYWRKF